MQDRKNLMEKINSLPEKAGCYLWKNNFNQIIYIGKAKNIKKRTLQYFNKNANSKIKLLIEQVNDIDIVVTNSENDALILERNLISKYKPKYNQLLRENGNYPYIVLTKEKNPRLIYTRNKEKFAGKVYGPFALQNNKKHDLFLLVNRLFPLRKCRQLPSKKCLYYDMGQCLGPCIKNVSLKEYDAIKKEIDNFFCGNFSKIKKELKNKELKSASQLDFEKAQKYLELQKDLDQIFVENESFFNKDLNIDVIGFFSKDDIITIIIFKYKDGVLLESFAENSIILEKEEDYLLQFLTNYYNGNTNTKRVYLGLNKKIILTLSNLFENIKFINPVKGHFKNMLSLAIKNAKVNNEQKYYKMINNVLRNETSLNELKQLLKMDNLSLIELYDNSNIQNDSKIGVKIAYVNGYKDKSLYRKYIFDDNVQQSDYHMMINIITRRFSKLKEDDLIPNLIIVDGGKIQVNAVINALEKYCLNSIITVIGLVKNQKHTTEKIFYNNSEIELDKNSNLYLFLLNMQEEVHRYAISFFRQKKTKSIFNNDLKKINGLGDKTIKKLLSIFDSIDAIKNASDNELLQVVSSKVLKNIRAFFQKN